MNLCHFRVMPDILILAPAEEAISPPLHQRISAEYRGVRGEHLPADHLAGRFDCSPELVGGDEVITQWLAICVSMHDTVARGHLGPRSVLNVEARS